MVPPAVSLITKQVRPKGCWFIFLFLFFILSIQLSLARGDCSIPHAGALARAFGSNLPTDVVTFVDTLQALRVASCGRWVLRSFYSFYIYIYVIRPCLLSSPVLEGSWYKTTPTCFRDGGARAVARTVIDL